MAQATGNGAPRKTGGILAIVAAALLFAAVPFQLAVANPPHGGGGGGFHAGGCGFHSGGFHGGLVGSTGEGSTAGGLRGSMAASSTTALGISAAGLGLEGSTRRIGGVTAIPITTTGITATIPATTITATIPAMATAHSPMRGRFGITAPTRRLLPLRSAVQYRLADGSGELILQSPASCYSAAFRLP